MSSTEVVTRALASAFLAGEWTAPGLAAAARNVFGQRRRWHDALARDLLAVLHRPPHDAPRELAALIACSPGFVQATEQARRRGRRLRVVRWAAAPTRMVRHPWPVPPLDDVADVAALLGVDVAHLDWLADPRHLQRRTAPGELHQYRYRWIERPGRAPRLLEAPRSRLLHHHRTLLAQVLAGIPVHPAAHGFVPGRSVATATAPHAGSAVVIRLDLRSFFACVTAGRVYGVLRAAGYPEPVAHTLTGLVTVETPPHMLTAMPRGGDPEVRFTLRRRLARAHLPAGAPTSPALANLVAHRLDARVAGYARAVGATYTRYADDLVLSGGPDLRRRASRVVDAIGRIATEEGFAVHPGKTRVRSASQRQEVLGVVVNDRPTVPRDTYDRLRAVLHNAARTGGEAQNRDGHPDFRAHLAGRIAWVASLDAARGARLTEMFERVEWELPLP